MSSHFPFSFPGRPLASALAVGLLLGASTAKALDGIVADALSTVSAHS